MKIYLYDEITKEYIETLDAYLDPAETEIKGEAVYMYPANSTEISPPQLLENQTCIFENGAWKITKDYRGQYQCNSNLEISIVENFGELAQDFILITKAQADKIAEDRLYYIVSNGKLVKNPQYEKQKAELEAERIAHLYLTAADVERGIYKAKGLDFDDIIDLVNKQAGSIDVKALKIEFKANHFYRGNPLVDSIGAILGFTKEQLDYFFKYKEFPNKEVLADA